MSRNKEIIHKFLDGEVSAEELQEVLGLIEADPRMKEEFIGLQETIRIIEESEKLSPPVSFAAEVMAKLPEPKVPFVEKVRDFLFGGRTLRWNMATALATAALAVIVISGIFESQNGIFQSRKKNELATPVNSTADASAVAARFALSAPKAKTVAIAGDFNKWKTDESLLKKQDGGIWTIEIPLNPGVYNYMFIVDGEVWVTDPHAGEYRDDGFGYRNSVAKVESL